MCHATPFRLAAAAVALLVGCGGPAPAPSPALPQRVDNPSLGIALAATPEGFRLESNGEGSIVLARKPELPPGTVTVEATPERAAGVNLVTAVNDRKAHIESLPGGKFQGQTELVGPTGRAYLTRGRYLDEAGREIEEMQILTLHPTDNRMLTLTYVYAVSGDTKDRAQQIMDVLAEVEALPAGTQPESEGGSDEPESSGADL